MSGLESVTRADVEDFLYFEAALLDTWRLEEWRALFVESGRYFVPAPGGDPYASADSSLYLIADDPHHLTERIKRLGKKTAYAESPRSTTCRLVSNVRIVESGAESLRVGAAFITYRTNQGHTDTYWGHHEYLLVGSHSQLKILEKRTILDTEVLRPQGKLTIIV